jgi:hypothetical protein
MAITILFIAGAVAFLLISGQFADVRISEPDPGAAWWPRAALVALLVAGLFNLFLLYRRAKRNDESIATSVPEFADVADLSANERKYGLAIVLSTVFLLSLEWIGFLVASPFFLFAFAYALGYRETGKLVVFSLAVGLLIFFAFRNIMNIPLPYGTGPFRELSVYASNLL